MEMGDRKPTPSSLARGLAPPKPPRQQQQQQQQQQHLSGKDKEDEEDGKLPPSTLLATKGEHESVFEYLVTVFESPSWTEPLAAFVDEYCVLFDAEEDGGAGGKESQFVHTKVHELFKDLVETLLLQHLDAVGVGLEAFVDACGSVTSKEAATRGEGEEQGDEGQEAVWQQVMDHLYAMEDFVAFSHLMVKRNLELELSEIEALLQEEGNGEGHDVSSIAPVVGEEEGGLDGLGLDDDIPVPLTPEEEEAQLEMALRASFDGSSGSGNGNRCSGSSKTSGGLGSFSSLSTPGTSLEGAIQVRRLSSLTASASASASSSSSDANTSITTSNSLLSRTAQPRLTPHSSLSLGSSSSSSAWRAEAKKAGGQGEGEEDEDDDHDAFADEVKEPRPSALPSPVSGAAAEGKKGGGRGGVEETKKPAASASLSR